MIDTLNIPFQVIRLTGPRLNGNNMDCYTLNEHEYFGSNRPNKRGVGVCLYISKQLKFKSWNDLDKNVVDIIETKFIEIINDNGKKHHYWCNI